MRRAIHLLAHQLATLVALLAYSLITPLFLRWAQKRLCQVLTPKAKHFMFMKNYQLMHIKSLLVHAWATLQSILVLMQNLEQAKIVALTQIVLHWVVCIKSTKIGHSPAIYRTTSAHLVTLSCMPTVHTSPLASLRWATRNLAKKNRMALTRKYAGKTLKIRSA